MMNRPTMSSFAALVAVLSLLLFAVPARADFTISYCSSQNTASNSGPFYSQWQSNGLCHDKCTALGGFAFAIAQDVNCWCSNYIPEDQQDTGNCNENCPGFPSEKCGSKDKGLYIYIKLDGSPSGTLGTSKPTSANVSPSSTAAPPPSSTKAPPSSEAMTPSAPPSPTTVKITQDPKTVFQTVTESAPVVTYTPSKQSSATPTTFQTTTTPAQTSVAPTDPQTSVVIVTESGRIVTQTVITTPSSAPALTKNQKSGTNTSAIVGGVVGGVGVLAAIAGGVLFFLWRRRRQQQQGEDFQSGVQRNTSTMSKSGLLRTEKEPQYLPPIATTFNRRQSRGLDSDSISPISGSDRRNSRPLVFDSRLNPSALMVFENSSRGSLGSVDDSRDYHRPLNVRNPDPAPE